MIVFWAAHVYAGTVAHHGFEDGRIVGIRESLRLALRRSWGLLISALIPSSILLLGVTHAVPDDSAAIWIALWTCVAVLAVLGYVAFARRRAVWYVRLLGVAGDGGVRHPHDPAEVGHPLTARTAKGLRPDRPARTPSTRMLS